MLYLRGTVAARALVSTWAERMERVGPEPWLDDQAVLNNMLREGLTLLPLKHASTSADNSTSREARRGLSGVRPSRTYRTAAGAALVGLLPLRLIANGHTFFVQHPCAMCRASVCRCATPLPVAVHTTFQYGDTADFAHGKRARLVQAGLWHTSPYNLLPQSDVPTGGGASSRAHRLEPAATEPGVASEEAERERYIAWREVDAEDALRRHVQRSLAADPAFAQSVLANDSRGLIHLHKELDADWRRRTLRLLAAALVSNRTAVLPHAWCFCDIYWGGMAGCRAGARTMALPFECPIDHLVDLPKWARQSRLRWRPPRYLQHMNRAQRARLDVLELSLSLPTASLASADTSPVAFNPPTPLCRLTASLGVADLALLSRLLRFHRLFCYVEGRPPTAGDAAPCCTEHSLRTAWTTDDDPRGRGYLPCEWGLRMPELPPAAKKGSAADRCEDVARRADRADDALASLRDTEHGEAVHDSAAAHNGETILAVCAANAQEGVDANASKGADRQLLRRWLRQAIRARGGSTHGIQVLSASSTVAALAAEMGVGHVHVLHHERTAAGRTAGRAAAAPSGSWAASAGACVTAAMWLVERDRCAVALSMPSVLWLRDPSPWVACDGSGAGLLQCAPVGPADVIVASDMLSVRQDALHGAGYAKWGALDPSLIVLRPTAAALGIAARWRDALLAEHAALDCGRSVTEGGSKGSTGSRGSIGSTSRSRGRCSGGDGASRAAELFRALAVDSAASWPGLQELEVVGVRQASRLFEVGYDPEHGGGGNVGPDKQPTAAEAGTCGSPSGCIGVGLLGVLPLALFANGHGYWVQRAQRLALATEPYALRLQLAPLAASHESATLMLDRLRHEELRTASPTSSLASATDSVDDDDDDDESPTVVAAKPLLLSIRLRTLPASSLALPGLAAALPTAGGAAAGLHRLGAHMVALAGQLQAVHVATNLAARLGRQFVAPRLTCHCDRDPSGAVAGLLGNGCRLPSAEAEEYLPYECPLEHVLDLAAWRVAEGENATGTLYPTTRAARHLVGAGPADRLEHVVQTGIDATSLAASVSSRLAQLAQPPRMVEIVWPEVGTKQAWGLAPPMASPIAGRQDRLSTAVRHLLARGPQGGWCVSCAQTPVPPPLRVLGVVAATGTSACRWCANFTRLLAYRGVDRS